MSSSAVATAPVVSPAGEGHLVRSFGNEILFKLTSEHTNGALAVGLATVPAGSAGPPRHVHDREDEMFLIIDGEYRVWIDGASYDAGPGSLVWLPRGIPHTFQVIGERDGRHWVLTTPGGFERFFAQTAEVFAAPGPPNFARIAEINAEHHVRFV